MLADEVLTLALNKGMPIIAVGQYETNTETVLEGVDVGATIVVVDPPVATNVPEPVLQLLVGDHKGGMRHTNVPHPEKLPLPDMMPDVTIDDIKP